MAESGESFIEVRDLVADYGAVTAVDGISFVVRQGTHLTLLGPSGCGKTTTLRVLAGLERARSGEIRIGGDLVYSSERGIDVPTERRRLGMVFQSYAIWPHMTVYENVAYGLKVRGGATNTRRAEVLRALEMVGMESFSARNASELSGGQQQRVALARALVVEPRVLLLDEPLSNLDARLRSKMRTELQTLQQRTGVTSVYVTHDQEEALAFSDQILVMRLGKIVQQGTPMQIYEQPRTEFVADFVGAANLLRGDVVDRDGGSGLIHVQIGDGSVVAASTLDRQNAATVDLAIRPGYLVLARSRPSDLNAIAGVVRQRTYLGDSIEYLVEAGHTSLLVRQQAEEMFGIGDEIFVTFPAHRCILLEP
jgi:iron(III) transport system ATP-binding protein